MDPQSIPATVSKALCSSTKLSQLHGPKFLPQNPDQGLLSGSDLELSMEDSDEFGAVDEFIGTGCGCKHGPGESQCSFFLAKKTTETCKQYNLELTRDELDLVVLAQIRAHHNKEIQATHHSTGSFRLQSMFFINGVQECPRTFLFLHCISRERYANLVQHYEWAGLCARQQDNLNF